jgi:hypothetical protein
MDRIGIDIRDRRWLACAGRTWVPIGLNASFVRAWTDVDEALCRQLSWIDRIADHGGNCARVWLSQPLFDPETQRAGTFDPASAERLRALLERARRRGVRLKLCLDHVRTVRAAAQAEAFPGAARFDKPLWAREAGGPADTMADYLDGADGRAHFLRRLAWFADLVGDDAVVWAWELWNEGNCGSGGDWLAWTRAMLPEAARRVPQLVMQSLGSLSSTRQQQDYAACVGLPGNAVAQVHRYLDAGSEQAVVRGPLDLACADAVSVVAGLTDDRPVLLSESGAVEANHAGPSRLYARDVEGTILHDVLFAPFFAGACGSGQCWHWDHHYVDRHGLWWQLGRFARAIEGLDPAAEALLPERHDAPGLRGWTLAGPRVLTAWLRCTASDWSAELERGERAPLISAGRWSPGRPASWLERARITAYDPWTDTWLPLTANGSEISLPAFRRSLVIRIVAAQ